MTTETLETRTRRSVKLTEAEPPLSLSARFAAQVARAPGADLFHFCNERGVTTASLTRAQLDRQARRIAALLRNRGLEAGDRVLLVYSFSLDVVPAFLGCLYTGVIPCPVAPVNPRQMGADLPRFEKLSADSGAAAVLTNREYARYRQIGNLGAPLLTRRTAWRTLPWLRTDATLPEPLEQVHDCNPDDIAFLQYTSGSTSDPKGVMITHRNLAAQIDALNARVHVGDRSRLVAWIPYFHDYCLVAGIVNVMMRGGQLYLMSPLGFLANPAGWFELLTRVRATDTAAPNFAYDYSVEQTTEAQRRVWDLSGLESMQSGGEPVQIVSVDRFFEAFSVSGLRSSTFTPAYGMAEHVLGIAVAGKRRIAVDRMQYEQRKRAVRSDAPSALELIGSGTALSGVSIEIVEPESCRALETGRVGEIWIDSASKALGYWNRPELTEVSFAARLRDADCRGDSRRFLRTGDLGFLYAGELFVSGRIKDTIIIRGRNLYPQDVEAVVSSAHPAICNGRVVAFGLTADTSGEVLAVIAELGEAHRVEGGHRKIVEAIRRQVTAALAIACHTVVLVKTGAVPKTTSGKLQRLGIRARYLDDELGALVLYRDELPEEQASTGLIEIATGLSEQKVLAHLVQLISTLGGHEPGSVNPDEPASNLAIDSVRRMSLVVEMNRWSGRELDSQQVFETGTLRDIAQAYLNAEPAQRTSESVGPVDGVAQDAGEGEVRDTIMGARDGAAPLVAPLVAPVVAMSRATDAVQAAVQGAVQMSVDRYFPLSPSQAWMFEPEGPVPHGWTIGGMVLAPVRIDTGRLQQALEIVVQHHEALRLRLVDRGDSWEQRLLATDAPQLTVIDLTHCDQAGAHDAIDSQVADRKSGLNMVDGPIVDLVALHLPPPLQDRILLLVHHIAVDAYSFELVATDLLRVYDQLTNGDPVALSPARLHYSDWMQKLVSLASLNEMEASAQTFLRSPDTFVMTPDRPEGQRSEGSAVSASHWLTDEQCRHLITEIPRTSGVPTVMLILSTLVEALQAHTGHPAHRFELVHHGRKDVWPDVDLSTTCGWTSINCPVTLSVTPALSPLAQARQVQSTVDSLPRKGLDYGVLRYLHPDATLRTELAEHCRPQVKFMWFGQARGLIQTLQDRYPLAPENLGASFDPEGTMHYLHFFYGTQIDGRIRLDTVSSGNCVFDQTRAALLKNWLQHIDRLIAGYRLA